MEFNYYYIESGSKFKKYFKFIKQVIIENFKLYKKAQKNLEKGIYTKGIFNLIKETRVVCKQFVIKKLFFKILIYYIKVYQQRILDLIYLQHEGNKYANSNYIVSSSKYIARFSFIELAAL